MKRVALFSIIVIMFVSCGSMSFEGLEYPNISGQISDRNNQPISNVKVYITDNYNKRFNDLSYVTNSEGRFFVKACIVTKFGIGCLAFDRHFIRIHTEKSGYKDADMFISFAYCDRYHDRIFTENIVLAAQ